jgi:hypothetical protein
VSVVFHGPTRDSHYWGYAFCSSDCLPKLLDFKEPSAMKFLLNTASRGNCLERRALPKHAGKYSDRKTLVSVMLFPLIVLRLLWRITHAVAPERSLPAWQHLLSETVR